MVAILALGLVHAAPPAAAPAPAAPTATLSRSSVPAKGREVADLTVSAFGRYAVTASSLQGTAVQLVDRMAGPGEVSGVPGRQDGRVNAFLDRGTVRVVALSDAEGKGNATLEARPYLEKSGPNPPLLPPLRELDTTLADFEQRSFWVRATGQPLAIEAAGRSLGDVRLWRDGTWLEPAAPTCEGIEAAKGKALTRCQLLADPEPGLYLLVLYGGPSLAWSSADKAQPLHVRLGVPPAPSIARESHVLGPTGTDRYVVAAGAELVRVELPEAADLSVTAGPWDAANPYGSGGNRGQIRKESLPPAVQVRGAGSRATVVTVTGTAGQPYVLQTLAPATRNIPVRTSGAFFVATLPTGDPGDSVDATAILAEDGRAVATAALVLSRDAGWRRRFNLLAPTSLVVEVKEAGAWQVDLGGVGGRFRAVPWLATYPKEFQAPPWTTKTGAVELRPGLWRLELEPDQKGIVELTIRPAGWGDKALEMVGMGAEVADAAPITGLQVPNLSLVKGRSYLLELGQQPEVTTGLVLRPLPLDLSDSLPVRVGTEPLSLPFENAERGVVSASGESGKLVEVSVDGGPFKVSVDVPPGDHTVAVRAAAPTRASLSLVPWERAKQAPLPTLPDAERAAVPEFPVVSTASPRFLDLGEGESATFRVKVDGAAMYRVESTGLLATAGAIRTRTNPALATAGENGVGRNFLVGTWLREGDYQLTVTAQGQSAGHLGVKLGRTAVRDGGVLAPGVPARAALPADTGISWTFRVEEPGEYVLRSAGPGRSFRVRLEDGDGWPLFPPTDEPGSITTWLERGSYRLVGLPEADATTRVTTLDRVAEPIARKGHGPFPLPLGTSATHTWWEPADGKGARTPDVWTFTMPAPATSTLLTSEEMAGTLVGPKGEIAKLVPGRPWTGRLDQGDHRLELTHARRNSGVEYNVSITTEELVAGTSRTVRAPVTLPISVGVPLVARDAIGGLYDLSTTGETDVRARLYAGGKVIGQDDDRPEDWNVQLQARLAPGAYWLRLDPVGARGADVNVTMRAVEEVVEPALPLGQARKLEAKGTVRILPIEAPADGLLVVTGQSAENVGVAVEVREGEQWRALESAVGRAPRLVVRLGGPKLPTRVRAWSLDGRGNPMTVRADLALPKRGGEGALKGGVTLSALSADVKLGAVAVASDRPGTFALETLSGVSWCPVAGEACRPVPGPSLPVAGESLWLVGAPGTQVRARRAPLASGKAVRLSLTESPAPLELARSGKGPTVAWVDAPGTVPVLRLAEGPAAEVAVAPDRALAVSLAEGSPVARVRAAEAVEASVTQVSFPAPSPATAPWGASAGTLTGARAFDLPSGDRTVRLTLDTGMVAVLSEGDVVRGVLWAADAPLAETIAVSPGRITLLDLGGAPGAWTLEVVHGATPARVLKISEPIEEVAATAGALHVTVEGPAGATMRHSGEVRGATLIDADGRAWRGDALRLDGRPATLVLEHGAGLWTTWVARPEPNALDRWTKFGSPSPAAEVTLPAQVAPSTDPRVPQRVSVRVPGPGLVTLRTSTPSVALWRLGQGPYTSAELHGTVELPVPAAGEVDIAWRTLAGLSPTPATLTFTPASPIGEGLGPEVVLAPGGARVFAFAVSRDGPVGVGVRADAAEVEAMVLDATGKPLAEGVVMMPTLAAGSYLLAVRLPVGAAPARARPALAGVTPPDGSPPDDVVRGYLEAAGLLVPSSAPVSE